ncbi:hypothetical protein BD410DRAFT_831293 [Rickenella mellea]|uniref:CoA-dependent acyltransferase n=1 Tax=Rickenella mellea TaxID=50990 RepID=A0A4Y7PQT9_9AGAM|nr:hypothetical protein BD410DRAFT_831293 [Rickenella mellea]
MPSSDPKPCLRYDRYKWRRDDTHPGRYKRQTYGGEIFADAHNSGRQGEMTLFIGVYATLSARLTSQELHRVLRRAWISLRWDVPTIAAQTMHDENAWISYDVAETRHEVEKWAEHTVLLREDVANLDELRYEVGQGIMPPDDLVPQTYLYLAPSSPTTFGVLMHTSHIPFDGSSLKILISRLFEHLAKYISDSHYEEIQNAKMRWGHEHSNLLPATVDILRKGEPAQVDEDGRTIVNAIAEEPLDGPAYTETLAKIMRDLARYAPKKHTFKTFIEPPYDPLTMEPKTRRATHTFTLEESNKIILTARAENLTVNHLLHAAMCLLPILDNPPDEKSEAFVFILGVVDCRHRLERVYQGADSYPGYCIGSSPIAIPVSIATSLPSSTGMSDKVLAIARVVRKQYKEQTSLPALLGVCSKFIETLLSFPKTPPFRGPVFVGDGRGNKYLRESYPETDHVKVIEITDFFIGMNKSQPGPAFRATEWKGRIMLSADYNEVAVERSVVERWVKMWAEFVLSVTE